MRVNDIDLKPSAQQQLKPNGKYERRGPSIDAMTSKTIALILFLYAERKIQGFARSR
ncbi:hypothetical protein [Pseudoduganella sp. HUAS MS19]